MSNVSKEVLRNYIEEQNFGSSKEVLSAMKEMFRDVLQEALEAEMDVELGYSKHSVEGNNSGNSRNGSYPKTIKSELGEIDLAIPRDRKGEYTPKIVPKHERFVEGIEEKILALYQGGMTTRDVAAQIKNLYDVEISHEFVSNVTNRIMPLVTEWQNRPLETTYAFVFLDAIHYKVREEKHVVKKAAYVALGVTMEGQKEVLGIWIGGNETSKFWLGVLNDMHNRGVKNVLIFCVDGLSGFQEAIEAVYPYAKIQRCIIHQLRASTRYISYTDLKKFVADMKSVYGAVNEEEALEYLMTAKEKWGKKYPTAIKSWEEHWDNLITFFEFPEYIRKIMYTTNAIESLNSQFRKVTKTKLIFPSDDSLLKMLYLATENISKKWTRTYRNWDLVLNQLEIMFEDVLKKSA